MVAAALEQPAVLDVGANLRVDAVSHAFAIRGAPLPVLDRVTLSVEPGGFVALLGPSGCGKSTLLRLVAGLEPPDQGAIEVDGALVEGPDRPGSSSSRTRPFIPGAPSGATWPSASKPAASGAPMLPGSIRP